MKLCFLVIPSLTISRLSLAVCNSSRACFTATSLFSYSSLPDKFAFEQFFHAGKVRFPLSGIDFCQPYTAFC